jgi:hypothetical protein
VGQRLSSTPAHDFLICPNHQKLITIWKPVIDEKSKEVRKSMGSDFVCWIFLRQLRKETTFLEDIEELLLKHCRQIARMVPLKANA